MPYQVQPSPECWLPYNPGLDTSVETCGEATMNGVGTTDEYLWSMALKTSTTFTSANESLGCFYVTNILDLKPLDAGWNFGLAFRDLPNGLQQPTADLVFAPEGDVTYTPRNCSDNTNVIMSRVPDGDGGSGDTQVCTKVALATDGGIRNRVSLHFSRSHIHDSMPV
jgi:hypothetical protein